MAANRWVQRINDAAEATLTLPTAGRIVPELSRPEIREVILGSFRLVYRVGDDEVEVLAVFDSHRLLESALPSSILSEEGPDG